MLQRLHGSQGLVTLQSQKHHSDGKVNGISVQNNMTFCLLKLANKYLLRTGIMSYI